MITLLSLTSWDLAEPVFAVGFYGFHIPPKRKMGGVGSVEVRKRLDPTPPKKLLIHHLFEHEGLFHMDTASIAFEFFD